LILKGNQRGGGQQLAAHLMNSFDNERVEIADVRGAVAQDLSGAFSEWTAQARATKCEKNFYSLSLNPDQAQGRLTREQYLDLLARTERSLNLVDQPRAVVFHEKRDKDGVLREHCHAVWSRIDTDRIKAVQIAHDRLKLRSVARSFARDHGLALPDGMKKDGRRSRFNDRAKQETLAERQQKERTGISKAERMSDIAGCWTETRNGAAFEKALEAKGYFLTRGDRRAYVVVDLNGEVHSLSKQLSGVAKAKDLRERLAGHRLGFSDIEAAQAWAKKQREQYEKQKHDREPSEIEKRRDALKAHQQQRRGELDHMRDNLVARHTNERDGLKAAQQAENTGIIGARLQKQPKGFMAFLTRVTGIKLITDARHRQQDKARTATHKQQTEALQRTHGRELHDVDRRYRALDRLEARENRSAELALKRERFQILVLKKPPQRVLKPEFDRAAGLREAAGNTGSGGLSAKFRHQAQDTGFRKGELQAAFERATSGKVKPAGDSGPAPADQEQLDRAQKARDEFRSRQPRPGPDRDREK
jgi:hypothetical protein